MDSSGRISSIELVRRSDVIHDFRLSHITRWHGISENYRIQYTFNAETGLLTAIDARSIKDSFLSVCGLPLR
jgi:hypothetical protein